MGPKKHISIIGGGPAALMLAAELDNEKYVVTLFEQNAGLGRKFLVAGQGGFNLTHSENETDLLKKYSPDNFLNTPIRSFNNEALRIWLKEKGIETYVGTSKRVFPVKGIKPIQVLNVFEKELKRKNVIVNLNHKWLGWDKKDALVFENKAGTINIKSDIVVFSLGGGSWKVTGSNWDWLQLFSEKKVSNSEFIPSNCAFKVDWDKPLKTAEGKALKNVTFSCNGKVKKGEAVLTKFGIEGSGVYGLSKEIREQLFKKKKAVLEIDMKPALEKEKILRMLQEKGNTSVKDLLSKQIKLSDAQIELLKNRTSKDEYQDPKFLSNLIKKFHVTISGLAPLDEAISTVGGIELDEIDNHFELKKLGHHFCIGEMLNWDAPTGGYLLQACFSMGNYLANYLNSR
jgi:uncharacterized flavoprotein (TIGR03862 family)